MKIYVDVSVVYLVVCEMLIVWEGIYIYVSVHVRFAFYVMALFSCKRKRRVSYPSQAGQ